MCFKAPTAHQYVTSGNKYSTITMILLYSLPICDYISALFDSPIERMNEADTVV